MGYNGDKADKVAKIKGRLEKKLDEVNGLMQEIHSSGGCAKITVIGSGGAFAETITSYVSVVIR